ncbi:MAG: nucleotidyltransferase domain-containing protein [Gemmatimonadaceae bacterium]|jgi:hypothetical protein|nr:nucleotidyltransferase domain-containing protein [Gemmatimonadaceae bacterium]
MHASPADAGTAHDLRVIREIVRRRLAGHGIRAWLFGSHATGVARRSSDVDVALRGDDRVPAEIMIDLRDELEDASVLRRVDLVDLATVDPAFAERVLREGILWTD